MVYYFFLNTTIFNILNSHLRSEVTKGDVKACLKQISTATDGSMELHVYPYGQIPTTINNETFKIKVEG